MTKHLPLVVFRQKNQLFALEAAFVRGQGRSDLLDATTKLLPFAQLLTPKTRSLTAKSAHWLGLAGSPSIGKQGAWLLGIEADAELVELAVNQIHPLPPLLQARREFVALQAVAWYQQQLVSLIDARVLLKLAHPLLTPAIPDASLVE